METEGGDKAQDEAQDSGIESSDDQVRGEAPAKPDGPLSATGSPQEERLHDPTAGDDTPATDATEGADTEE